MNLLMLYGLLGLMAQAPPPGKDLYGDPLPPGTVARLGTVRFRHPGLRFVRFSADGKTLWSGGSDGFRQWDLKKGEELLAIEGNAMVAALSPDGKTFVSEWPTGKLSFWNSTTGAQGPKQLYHGPRLSAISFSPDGKMLASVSQDRGVMIEGQNGKYYYSQFPRGEIRLWAVRSPAIVSSVLE